MSFNRGYCFSSNAPQRDQVAGPVRNFTGTHWDCARIRREAAETVRDLDPAAIDRRVLLDFFIVLSLAFIADYVFVETEYNVKKWHSGVQEFEY